MHMGKGYSKLITSFFYISGILTSQRALSYAIIPLADHLHKAGEWAESNNTIMAIDFISHYCVSRGNSVNTCPNLKMDTHTQGYI